MGAIGGKHSVFDHVTTEGANDYRVPAGEDMDLRMGDSAGVNSINFKNLAGTTVASINSLGAFTSVGMSLTGPLIWTSGTAVTATAYWIGRDADATNQLHFNVPTGATFEWSINDVSRMTLDATGLNVGSGQSTYAGNLRVGSATPSAAKQLLVTQGAGAGSSGLVAFEVVGGAHTTLTASTESTDVLFDLSATKQFATGALAENRDIRVKNRTLGFVGASTVDVASTFSIDGGPLAGTNATISISSAFTAASWQSNATGYSMGGFLGIPGIANGVGSTSGLSGVIITSSGFGNLEVGNQTATTDDYAALFFPNSALNSTTNVRTFTDAAVIKISGLPQTVANVTFTNGPYGINVSPSANFAQIAGNTPAAINIPDATMTLQNATQITSTGPAGIRIGQITVNGQAGATTIDNFAALYIKGAGIAGGGDTITNNYAVWVDDGLCRFDAGLLTKQSVANVTAAAPTDAELDAAFGTPASLGRGFVATIDDNNDDTVSILVWTTDASWYYSIGVKAV